MTAREYPCCAVATTAERRAPAATANALEGERLVRFVEPNARDHAVDLAR